jgi:hypothetical protein
MRRRLLEATGFVVGVACVGVACGARTGLGVGEGPDASVDAAPDIVRDVATPLPEAAPPDVDHPDVPKGGCSSNAECSDVCTVGTCNLATGVCTERPRKCEPGFTCVEPVGCIATSLAVTNDALYGVSLPVVGVDLIGLTAMTFDDIALRADGTLYAVTTNALYIVDVEGGATTLVAPLAESLNALDFGKDQTLYGAGPATPSVYTVDPKTAKLTSIATLPVGYESSGDLAVVGGTLFLSVNDLEDPEDTEDSLAAIDLSTFDVTIVGKTGYTCIYGLSSFGSQLFGFTCGGQIIQMDTTTAASTLLASTGDHFYGASASRQ